MNWFDKTAVCMAVFDLVGHTFTVGTARLASRPEAGLIRRHIKRGHRVGQG